jgi:hypothetical protein
MSDGQDDRSSAGWSRIGVGRAGCLLPLPRRLQGDRFAGFQTRFQSDEIYFELEPESGRVRYRRTSLHLPSLSGSESSVSPGMAIDGYPSRMDDYGPRLDSPWPQATAGL